MFEPTHYCPFNQSDDVDYGHGASGYEYKCAIGGNPIIGENISLFPGTHNQSPRLSLISTIIQRAQKQLPESFYTKNVWATDYETLKEHVIKQQYKLGRIDYDILPNIIVS